MIGTCRTRLGRSVAAFLPLAIVLTSLTFVPAASAAPGGASAKEGPEAPHVVRELTALRSESAEHYELSDGTFRATLHSAPVRFRNAQGKWQGIDTTLIPADEAGKVEAVSTPISATFSDGVSADPMVELQDRDFSLGIDLVGTQDANKIVMGDQVVYPNVATNTDLVYESHASGVKDTLLLHSAAAPSSFTFFVSLDGLELLQAPNGGFEIVAQGGGEKVGALAPLAVFDSAGDDGVACANAETSVRSVAGGVLITYSVPKAWMQDAARVFPVHIDPSVTFGPLADTYIHSTNNTYGQQYDHSLYSGYSSAKGEHYSLLYFDLSALQGAVVDDAALTLCNWGGNVGRTQSLARNTSDWSPDIIYSQGRPSSLFVASATLQTTGVTFNVTSTVRGWCSGSYPKRGFQLYSQTAGSTQQYMRYGSSEADDPEDRPMLTVGYSAPGATTATATTSGFDWYSGGGPADTGKAGRGAVSLSWPEVSGATGYKIFAFDGAAYREVGTRVGASSTTWTSEGAGLFPADSAVSSLAGGANGFSAAVSPGAGSVAETVTVSGLGTAGLVVTDGTYLYMRRYAWEQNGPATWQKIGTGAGGTVKGQSYGSVGASLAGRGASSAFFEDDVLWNGFSVGPNLIEGYSVDATAGASVRTHWFEKDLLNRYTGTSVSAYSSNLMLAADEEQIYSIAQSVGTGGDGDGFKIRTFAPDGTWESDHTIPMPVDELIGAISDGEHLYLIEWNETVGAVATKISLSDYTVIGRWQMGELGQNCNTGAYDFASECFWIGQAYSAPNIFKVASAALDLRDDPRSLYRKTAPTSSFGDDPGYHFKVVPFNGAAIADISQCAATSVMLPKRSASVSDDPRHTEHDAGKMGADEASVRLDNGTLVLSAEELSARSYGPEISLARTYVSSRAAQGRFAPGWVFDFERSLSVDATGATYTDGKGDTHRFTSRGSGAYWAPNGLHESLVATSATSPGGGQAAYQLTHADKRSYALFDAAGKLLAETESHGDSTVYAITSSSAQITAANGHAISVITPGAGQLRATYSAGTVARKVDYSFTGSSSAGTATATYSFSDTATSTQTPGYTQTYVYSNGRVAKVTVSQDETFAVQNSTSASWDVSYGAGNKLASITAPYYKAGSRAVTSLTYDTPSPSLTSVMVTQSGEVSGTVTSVLRTYGISPGGTTAWMTNAYKAGDSQPKWFYEYDPNAERTVEKNPLGDSTTSGFDKDGNLIIESDGLGRTTTHDYNSFGDETRKVDPRGSVITSGYNAAGDLLWQEKTLNASDVARNEWSYDSHGRTTLERQALSGADSQTHWVTTQNAYTGSAASFTEPSSVTKRGQVGNGGSFTNEPISLSPTTTVDSIVTGSTYDALGNQTVATDALGAQTEVAFDAAGRELSSTDASGMASVTNFDGLGRTIASWKQKGSDVIEYQTSTNDPFGRLAVESIWKTSGAKSTATLNNTVTHTYDAMGREQALTDSLVTGEPGIRRHDAEGREVAVWPVGLTAAQAADLSYASRRSYDGAGRVVLQKDPAATTGTTTVYDAAGAEKVVTASDGLVTTSTYAEKTGDKTAESRSDGTSQRWAYDAAGRTIIATDTAGLATAFVYDLAGRQIAAQASGKTTSSSVFNAVDWQLRATDADGVRTDSSYDACGRLLNQVGAAQSANPKVTTSRYDGAGHLLRREDPDGRLVELSYDGFGRTVEEKHTTAAGVVKDIAATLDSLSRTSTSTDNRTGVISSYLYPTTLGGTTKVALTVAGVSTTLTVDSAGREITRQSLGSGLSQFTRSVTSTDAAGRVTGWSLSTGHASGRTFDSAGHQTQQTGSGLSGTGTYTYGDDGRKSRDYLPLSLGGTIDSNYAYTDGRLTSVTGAAPGSFAYSPAGEITIYTASISSSDTTSGVLTYDAQGRLASRKTLGGAALEIFGWDTANGWRTSSKRSGEASVTYAYAGNGRMSGYHKPAGARGIAASIDATYTYDALGQRVGSVVTSGTLTTTTRYVYDGLKLLSLAATESAGATYTISYLYDAEDKPYAGIHRAGATSTLFGIVTTDRGDVVALTDGGGAPFAAYRYDAWGRVLSSTSPGSSTSVTGMLAADIMGRQPLRYAGYAHDRESGLYYLSARYYDPATMQFTGKDAAKSDGEASAYQYCGGNPVSQVDPSGLWEWTVFLRHYLTKAEADKLNNPAKAFAVASSWASIAASMIAAPAGFYLGALTSALSVAAVFLPSFQYRKNDLISWSRSDRAWDAVKDGMCHWKTSHWYYLRALVISNGATQHSMVKNHQDQVNVYKRSTGKKVSGDVAWPSQGISYY